MKSLKRKLLVMVALLATSLCAFAAEWAKPSPNNSPLEDGKKYYIYSMDAEKFFFVQGVQLQFNDAGTPLTLHKLDNGDWSISSYNGYLYSDVDYVGTDGGSTDANSAWYIEKQDAGYSYLRPSKTDIDYPWTVYPDMWTGILWEGWKIAPIITSETGFINWYFISESDFADFESKVNLHKVMTELEGYGYDVSKLVEIYNSTSAKADLDAAIASVDDVLKELRIENASEEKPVDVTYKYVRNADLTENWVSDGHDVPGWTMVPENFCGMGTIDSDSFYSQGKTLGSWSGGAFGDNKVYQKISGLKNGKYKFGNYGIWIRHTGEDGDPTKGGYIYAKVGDKLYREPLMDTGWYRGLSEVEFECRSGEAEIGIMFEGTNIGQCIIIDFKLEYLGEKPAEERLNTLISNAQGIIAEGKICSKYIDKLNQDITKANELIASGDKAAQEVLFAEFNKDCEDAIVNKEAYPVLSELVEKANLTIGKGDSEEMNALSDYMLDNVILEKVAEYGLDNDEITKIIAELTELVDKAANSIVETGADVTHLLVNGKFDTNGGWLATKGDFGIDTGKKVMEKWWGDWKAEQIVENVANGKYRLEVQGFQWCSWDWSNSDSDWANSNKDNSFKVDSKVRLNDGEVSIYNVYACGKTDIQEGHQYSDYYVPDNSSVALKFFELGLYNNVVEANVTNNTLKVEFDCSSNGFWNCFYNLRLIYLGADMNEALANLEDAAIAADEAVKNKMNGGLRKQFEEQIEKANGMNNLSSYNDVLATTAALKELVESSKESIADFKRLASALEKAEEVLAVQRYANTEAGKELNSVHSDAKADYDSEYPEADNVSIAATIKNIETLITKAKIDAGVKAGDEITDLIINPSFENLYGMDNSVSGGISGAPYGWNYLIEGKECQTAQEVANAGINSFTTIESNDYAPDGQHSYCLLSAPTPDAYLYQTIYGLEPGVYRVTVDMNVTYDGGCSRLTGQRLLVNNVAEYYGKAENYIESELDKLHPEEVARTFGGYSEIDTNTTGEMGDMGNMQKLSVDVTILEGQTLTLGVRTDNFKQATTCNYNENYWDCCGRFKIDNFRLYCISKDVTGIIQNKQDEDNEAIYNLMGIKVNPSNVRGIYIKNGKKYVK